MVCIFYAILSLSLSRVIVIVVAVVDVIVVGIFCPFISLLRFFFPSSSFYLTNNVNWLISLLCNNLVGCHVIVSILTGRFATRTTFHAMFIYFALKTWNIWYIFYEHLCAYYPNEKSLHGMLLALLALLLLLLAAVVVMMAQHILRALRPNERATKLMN